MFSEIEIWYFERIDSESTATTTKRLQCDWSFFFPTSSSILYFFFFVLFYFVHFIAHIIMYISKWHEKLLKEATIRKISLWINTKKKPKDNTNNNETHTKKNYAKEQKRHPQKVCRLKTQLLTCRKRCHMDDYERQWKPNRKIGRISSNRLSENATHHMYAMHTHFWSIKYLKSLVFLAILCTCSVNSLFCFVHSTISFLDRTLSIALHKTHEHTYFSLPFSSVFENCVF